MTNEKRLEILKERFAVCEDIFQSKGESYAGKQGDALRNFKVVAELIGITPYQVQMVYFLKHVLSLTNAVKDNPGNPVDKSEGNDGRVTDVINYAVLFECLAKENKSKTMTSDEFEKRNKVKEVHPLLQTPSPEVEKAVIKDFEKTFHDECEKKVNEFLTDLVNNPKPTMEDACLYPKWDKEENITDMTIKNICELLNMDFDKENKLEMIQTMLNVYYTSKD